MKSSAMCIRLFASLLLLQFKIFGFTKPMRFFLSVEDMDD